MLVVRIALVVSLCLALPAQVAAAKSKPAEGPQPLLLADGWTDYGFDYAGASIHKDARGMVHLSGLIRSGDWPALVANLPDGFRPAARVIAGGNVHISDARVDILPTGEVLYIAGRQHWDWLSLSGISFPAAPADATRRSDLRSVALDAGWADLGAPYLPAATLRTGGRVYAQGVVHGEGGQVGTIERAHRPAGRLMFNALKGGQPSRVDVLADGRVVHVAGGGPSWLSLSSLAFEQDPQLAQPLPLVGGWVDYGGGYAPATFYRDTSGRVHVQGLIRSGDGPVFAQLPEGHRPAGRLVFSANHHEAVMRVDVTPDGLIVFAGGASAYPWRSLSGISFHAG